MCASSGPLPMKPARRRRPFPCAAEILSEVVDNLGRFRGAGLGPTRNHAVDYRSPVVARVSFACDDLCAVASGSAHALDYLLFRSIGQRAGRGAGRPPRGPCAGRLAARTRVGRSPRRAIVRIDLESSMVALASRHSRRRVRGFLEQHIIHPPRSSPPSGSPSRAGLASA